MATPEGRAARTSGAPRARVIGWARELRSKLEIEAREDATISSAKSSCVDVQLDELELRYDCGDRIGCSERSAP